MVPIYGGQFRIVPADVVLADIAAQVAAGAEHITFGDPDFFNGPTHAMRVVEALHAAHPDVTYDVTIKVEHLLRHRDAARPARRDRVRVRHERGRIDRRRRAARCSRRVTRAQDFVEAVSVCRDGEPDASCRRSSRFTRGSRSTATAICSTRIDRLDLVDHVAPIQLAIRLLIPGGSRLLELDDVRARIGPFDAATLAYPWVHTDPRVDDLHREIARLVGVSVAVDRRAIFGEIAALAYARAGRAAPHRGAAAATGRWCRT